MSLVVGQNNNIYNPQRKEKFVKKAVVAASSLAVLGATLYVAKNQGNSLISKKNFWKNLKTNFMKTKFHEKEVITLATASVGGGLTAGLVFDKENKKAKFKETISQMVGNILFPIVYVSTSVNYYHKVKSKIKMPQFKNDKQFVKNLLNRVSKATPAIVAGTGGLIVGIFAGNFVANKLNDAIFGKDEKREIKLSDFSGHVDDTCLAITLVAKNSNIGKYVSRAIPFALVVPGIETGIKKD